jgi:hypothetical protein
MSMIAPVDAATAEGMAPSKPRMTLRVGIVGHRPDRLGEHVGIEEQIGAVLMALKAGLIEIKPGLHCFADAPPEIRIVTGIAHGVDRMAARQAKACKAGEPATGPQVAWRLELISPAPIGVAAAYAWADAMAPNMVDYAREWTMFTQDADTITELPCIWRRHNSGRDGGIPSLPADFAAHPPFTMFNAADIPPGFTLSYVEAAEFQLRQIDLLMAVWDGHQSDGPGGTFDIADRAHAAGMPVIMIKIDAKATPAVQPPRFVQARIAASALDIAGWHPEADGFAPEENLAIDQITLQAHLLPLFQPPKPPKPPKDDHGHGGPGNITLDDFLAERLTANETPASFKLFTNMFSGKARQSLSRAARGFLVRLWHLPGYIGAARAKETDRARQDRVHRLVKKAAPEPHWAKEPWDKFIRDKPGKGEQDRRLADILLQRFITADRLAVDYADRYRASVILSYLFAGAAASLAIFGLAFLGDYKQAKLALLGIEFVLIAWIMAMVGNGRRDRQHAKLVDYRALAESLRHILCLAGIGEYPATARMNRPSARWVNWYLLMTAREIGLPSDQLGEDYRRKLIDAVMTFEIMKQIGYHQDKAAELHQINHRLHWLGDRMFHLSLWAVTAGAVAVSLYLMGVPLAKHALPVTGFVAAAFPAIGAAFTGIRFALDLETKEERHNEMAAMLKALEKQGKQPATWQRWSNTRDFLRDLEELLTRDIERFHSSYAGKAITLPA